MSIGIGTFLTLAAIAYGQQPSANSSTIAASTAPKKPLPVLLIHDFLSDASIWNTWQALFKKDGIPSFPVRPYSSTLLDLHHVLLRLVWE